MKKSITAFALIAIAAAAMEFMYKTSAFDSVSFFIGYHVYYLMYMMPILIAVTFGVKNCLLWFGAFSSLQIIRWIAVSLRVHAITGSWSFLTMNLTSWGIKSALIMPAAIMAALALRAVYSRTKQPAADAKSATVFLLALGAGLPFFMYNMLLGLKYSKSVEPFAIILLLAIPAAAVFIHTRQACRAESDE